MALLNTYFTPRELSGYARDALRDYPQNQPSLARWLPYNVVDDIEFRFTRGDNGLMTLAPFRTYDAESSIAGRKGVTRETRSLPPISRKKVLGEYDQLIKRANPDSLIQAAILSDVDDLVAQIAMSFEYEMADALNSGTVTPPGLPETITFNRSGSNSTTANVYWSNTGSSDPISDLRQWAKYYRQKNGTAPGTILMSEDSLSYMLQSAAVRALAGNLSGTPTVVDETTLGTILTRNRLPQIETYEVQYDTGNGTPARILPNSTVLLLPAATDPGNPAGTKLGATVIGTTVEASKPNYDLADSQAGIVVGNYEDEDPAGIWTKANAIGLVNLMNPDLSFKATVGAY
jgi:Phage major capsid protein E